MVPSIRLADRVSFAPVQYKDDPSADLFHLDVSNARFGTTNRYLVTHVPPDVRKALDGLAGECEVHIVAIGPNSLASHLLPGRPQHLLTGVTLSDGSRVAGLPEVLRQWRRRGTLACLAALLGGGMLALFVKWVLVGWLLSCTGAFFVRTFAGLPGRDFWGHEDK